MQLTSLPTTISIVMSTQRNSEIRNEIDDEPEEGEIQDDEGSLENVSSDDEISPLAKRKERGIYTSTFVSVRGQFVTTERRQIRCTPRRERRLCPSERSDQNLKKCQTRARAKAGVPVSYHESAQRYKSSKEHTQKVSGKIHEKENKAKESKKARRRSMSFHGSGNEPRSVYLGSEHADSYISSSTSSKGPWHKGDVKEKHRKKKRSSKSNKFSNPLGEVCASQLKTGRDSTCIDECVKSGGNAKEENLVSQETTKPENEKSELSLALSPSSDIQILDVPLVVPEIITICDSDEEGLKNEGNCEINIVSGEEEGNVCVLQLPPESSKSPVKEVVEKDNDENPEDNLKLLREAALKSSKPESCVNMVRDDEVLQLRLAALRSAIIRKYEERKKRGITLAKINRSAGDKQVMSISPLGSPNYCSSGDSSIHASDEIDHDLNSPFEFNVSLNQNGVSEPTNDSEVDKITTIDMELAESDDEKEHVCTESGDDNYHEINENIENDYTDSYKADSEPCMRHPEEIDYLIYPVDEPLAPVVSQDSSSLSPGTVCTIDPPAGYIIGDQDEEQASVFVSNVSETLSPQHSLFASQSAITVNSEECGIVEDLVENKIPPSEQREDELPNGEQVLPQVHENIVECNLTGELNSKSFCALADSDTVEFENTESRNDLNPDVMSSRSDCSFLSPVSGELDLDSMIILDEVSKSSDDSRSECSVEDVFNSKKFQNCSCEETQNISENFDTTIALELYEENSGVNLSSLICNSGNSKENVAVYADNFEASEDNTEMFEKNSEVNLYDVNSKSPVVENEHMISGNFETRSNNLKVYEKVPDLSLKILLSDSQGSNDFPSQENLHEVSKLEVSEKTDSIAICETSNRSCSDSQNGTELEVNEISSQAMDSIPIPDNSASVSKFPSGENDRSSGNLVDVERETGDKALLQAILSPICEKKISSHDKESVHDPSNPGSDICSSVDELPQTNLTVMDNTSDMKTGENKSNTQETLAEDDENVLRDSLLAMLKRKTEDQSSKFTSDTSQNGETVCKSSINKLDDISKNIVPISLQTVPHAENFISASSCKNSVKNCNLIPVQMSLSCSTKTRQSFVNSLPKHVYLSCSSSASKRGAKSNKLRGRGAKVPGRFNVNVPKLVINLGEDSDSGEDAESVPVKSVQISNLNGSDASEELRDNLSGSKIVPPDFEKKLDLLLKQARFQQETSSKDENDISSERRDLSAPCLNKIIKLPSTNFSVNMVKNSKNLDVSSGSSVTHTLPVSKVSPLVVHGANNQRGKNTSISVLNRDRIIFSGNNVNVTMTSTSRTVEANKRNLHARVKCTSAIAHPSSSVSSVVDIGLLPSSKQKEYIRLKKQLAQLARKEQEVKTKGNVTFANITRLPIKKSGLEEAKVLVSADVRNGIVKNSVGLTTEKSQFTRKFVRKGQGGTLISRTDFGKSKRIVKTISSSYSSQAHLRNRLTVTTPNRLGGASLEGSSIVRRVLCVPQKRIVTALPTVKKVSPDFQITYPNVNICAGDVQKKLASHVNKTSTEHANVVDVSLLEDRTKIGNSETQESENIIKTGDKTQKKCIRMAVLKRKGNGLDANGLLLRKKCAIQQEPTKEQAVDELHLTNTDVHKINVSDECATRLNDCVQKLCVGQDIRLPRRKRSNSEQSGTMVRKKSSVLESTKQQTVLDDGSNSKELKQMDIVDRSLAEGLWYTESKLISKRFQVLEDIATVQLNLHEIEKVSELRQLTMRDIQRLQKEMSHAEAQLSKKDNLLKVLYSEVEKAKRDIMRKQSETLLLSVECEEMGGRVRGCSYSIPNTCTDLIRNGMATISKTLQQLQEGKNVANSESERSTLHSSGEAFPKVTDATQLSSNSITENLENVVIEDSSKQTRGLYLSPLEAMKAATEPTNDNQAVLCPYHIMGSCKDKECSYLH